MSINYEQLLIENRKSFREALRRQRKANKILREENERLKAICFVKDSEVTAPVNQEDELPTLDFTSLFNYVKSLQQAMGLNDEEASTTFWVIDMWQRKKVYDPCEFKQPKSFTKKS